MEPWPWKETWSRRLQARKLAVPQSPAPQFHFPQQLPPSGRGAPIHFYFSLRSGLPTLPLQCPSPDTALHHTLRNLSPGPPSSQASRGPRGAKSHHSIHSATRPPTPQTLKSSPRPVSDPPSDGRSNKEVALPCHPHLVCIPRLLMGPLFSWPHLSVMLGMEPRVLPTLLVCPLWVG